MDFSNRAPDAVDDVTIITQRELIRGPHIEERFDGRGNPVFLRLGMTAYDLGDPFRLHFAGRG